MSAACYHFLLRTVFTGSTPPDWPEKDTHRIASEKMSDGHVKIKWEDKLVFPYYYVPTNCLEFKVSSVAILFVMLLQRRARRHATINVVGFSDVTRCQNMVDVSDVTTCQNKHARVFCRCDVTDGLTDTFQ